MDRRQCLRLASGLFAAIASADETADELPKLQPGTAHPERSLSKLLDSLRELVKDRDYRALELLLEQNFRVEFDVGKGPKAFHAYWCPQTPDSTLWPVLDKLLSLDGAFYSKTLFCLPYVFARFPFDLDPLEHVVALGSDVRLLSAPDSQAEMIGSLDHSIVSLAEPLQPPVLLQPDRFLEIKHPTIGRCYVWSPDVYHPAAHRMFFEKRNGQWKWISLAAATMAEPPDLLHPQKRLRADEKA